MKFFSKNSFSSSLGNSSRTTKSSLQPNEFRFFDFLAHIHPLIKILAIFPWILWVSFTQNRWIISFFCIESTLLLLLGSGIAKKKLLWILVTLIFVSTFYFLLFAFTASAQKSLLLFSIGPIAMHQSGVTEGLSAAIRVLALVLLSFLFTGTTSVTDFLYSLMQQGKLPYLIGYTITASYHFVPILGQELRLVYSAQKIRGLTGKSPWVWYRRIKQLAIALFTSSLRRADRLALSMEARSFGAHSTCTFYRQVPIKKADLAFLFYYLELNKILLCFLYLLT